MCGQILLNAQNAVVPERDSTNIVDNPEKRGTRRPITLPSHGRNARIDSVQFFKDSITVLLKTIDGYQQELSAKGADAQLCKEENDSLKQTVQWQQESIDNQIIQVFGNEFKDKATPFFCRALLESPLYYAYDPERIKYSLAIAKGMRYDNKNNSLYSYYEIYCVLLENYQMYNSELINNLNQVIGQFATGHVNRGFERERFEDRLKWSEYYKIKNTGKKDELKKYRHIFYLDFQIEKTRQLFDRESEFKKENFESIVKLLKQNL